LRAAELLRAEVSTLVFTPDRLGIVKGAPAVSRAYFDRALGRLVPRRRGAVGGVRRRCRSTQRRVAPRCRTVSPTRARSTRGPEQVAALGTELRCARAHALELLTPAFARLTGASGSSRGSRTRAGPSRASSWTSASRAISSGARRSVGPHLDDVAVLAGDRDLRTYGSQGEQRLAVLSLLLAESEILLERGGVPPLLLLDDVLSELDPERRATWRGSCGGRSRR
jgi:DNA replication and repair protein RecF